MQVQLDPEPRLVDLEESTEPRDEDARSVADRCWRSTISSLVLLPSPAYSASPSDEELPLGQLADPLDALLPAALDLGQLARRAADAGCPRSDVSRRRGFGTNSTSRTHSDTLDLRHAELGGDVLQRPRLGAQLSRPRCSLTLPPYPMPSSMTRGCLTTPAVTRSRGTRAGAGSAAGGAAWRASWPRSGGSARG